MPPSFSQGPLNGMYVRSAALPQVAEVKWMPAGFQQMGEENASKDKGIRFGIHIYKENI